ncbi:MAG: histidinol dehydrogenase [Bacteroidetes bacterium]|nr:histidinol dehydrogenase [Bacteroidota bacterium]
MKIIKYPAKTQWPELLKRPVIDTSYLEETVTKILVDVKLNGDATVKKYTSQFDGSAIENALVSIKEFDVAEKLCSNELKAAINLAKKNIEQFHISQKEEVKIIETTPGVKCWRNSIGIEKVGLYIPGGSAPLFSTILMLGVPATIAGCREIILCSPPDKNGNLNPAILYTAKLVGVTKVFKIGGVQAIAAMAYGTETVSKVFKIFGPGNQYVTCAKQLVNKNGIAIDMPAGPSELAILADNSCAPAFVAADLLSQAEHGEDSQVILVSDNETVILEVISELKKQLSLLPRKDICTKALENSKFILLKNINEAIDLINEYAPEHLIIACKNDEELSDKIINAGSVFLGNYSCESAGDYASGTNHTLPTNGYAKAYSGVSLDSFVKKITYQKLTKKGIQTIGPAIELMAEAEGLQAHKNAVTLRLKK